MRKDLFFVSLIHVLVITFFNPVISFLFPFGGCFSDKTTWGWPFTVAGTVYKCMSCCPADVSYPYDYVDYLGVFINISYYVAVIYVFVYLLTKFLKRA